MGLLRFVVTPAARVTEAMWQRAYLCGDDGTTWQTRASNENGVLSFSRASSDSASLQLPWLVPGRGWLTLATSPLLEQSRAYHLPLELARRAVGQLREQLAEWQGIGLVVSGAILAKANEAVKLLSRAAVTQDAPASSAEFAERAIAAALDAGDQLAATYVDQSFVSRRRAASKQCSGLGCDLGRVPLDDATATTFLACFGAARAPLGWREIEASEGRYQWALSDAQVQWSRAQRLEVCGGPLVDLDPHSLPDWLCLWEEDFDSVLAFSTEFVRAAVERYRGKVDLWVAAARMNTGQVLGLNEEEKLRLTARTVETVRQQDPDTPVVVSFDQPWAEYLARRALEVPPLHLADALVRAGLKLSGLMLEINLGFQPQATYPRSLLEFSRQMDLWSYFGLPLWISISAPGGNIPSAPPTELGTLRSQQVFAARVVPLLLAKPYVQAVFWNQIRDDQPRGMARAGLFDAAGKAKPALKALAAVRQTYLNRQESGAT